MLLFLLLFYFFQLSLVFLQLQGTYNGILDYSCNKEISWIHLKINDLPEGLNKPFNVKFSWYCIMKEKILFLHFHPLKKK